MLPWAFSFRLPCKMRVVFPQHIGNGLLFLPVAGTGKNLAQIGIARKLPDPLLFR